MQLSEIDSADVLDDLQAQRWSCRGYLGTPVSDETVRRLLEMAQKAPSWCNTQPWHLTVLRGQQLEAARKEFVEYAQTHEMKPDIPFPERYEGEFRRRRRECGWQLYESVGIVKGDRDASQAQAMENFRFFGAPAVAVVTTEQALGAYGVLDCGVYLGNFLLAAQSLGLATIAQASIAAHSDFWRTRLVLPDNRQVVVGISFGYPDEAHPANGFRTTRADAGEAAELLR
ncbi:nitroreductase [Amycolatopsis saalfeldensis]|uniref:Nitroreductase n=1 Tax=Amycolatopsis saalfeldensis TaxID=394193 RepID=A0A1H8XY82_9PSEU|nr:nitroreductase [Amycolatopsis saalfeldensis]SEP44712.1 Nitroreductase [Amycolatopsis saalfeldensis]